ncbi:Sterile alpha and TIR motif-containing protein 1, partial [Durusdinium trenchii]
PVANMMDDDEEDSDAEVGGQPRKEAVMAAMAAMAPLPLTPVINPAPAQQGEGQGQAVEMQQDAQANPATLKDVRVDVWANSESLGEGKQLVQLDLSLNEAAGVPRKRVRTGILNLSSRLEDVAVGSKFGLEFGGQTDASPPWCGGKVDLSVLVEVDEEQRAPLQGKLLVDGRLRAVVNIAGQAAAKAAVARAQQRSSAKNGTAANPASSGKEASDEMPARSEEEVAVPQQAKTQAKETPSAGSSSSSSASIAVVAETPDMGNKRKLNDISATPPAQVGDAASSGHGDQVVASAFVPDPCPESDVIVTVWVYSEADEAAVVAEEEKNGRRKSHSKHGLLVERGAPISAKVALSSPGLEIVTEEDTIAHWHGARANMSFMMLTKDSAMTKPQFLRLALQIGDRDVGQLPVLMRPLRARNTQDASGTNAGAELWVYPGKTPHIFLSYRRCHSDLADRIRLYLEREFHYRVFLDANHEDEESLTAGDFQSQLEQKLDDAKVVVPVLTPSPSGPDPRRAALSYLGCVKDSAEKHHVDWCYRELQIAVRGFLTKSKIIIPVFRGVNLGPSRRAH